MTDTGGFKQRINESKQKNKYQGKDRVVISDNIQHKPSDWVICLSGLDIYNDGHRAVNQESSLPAPGGANRDHGGHWTVLRCFIGIQDQAECSLDHRGGGFGHRG